MAELYKPSFKVKISGDDSTPDYIEDKLSSGSGVNLSVSTPGGNEGLIISISGVVHNSLSDMPDTSGLNIDHDARYHCDVSVTAPTSPVVGKLWLDIN